MLLGRFTMAWGAAWLVIGLFLILNDLAGWDVLWEGTADSGGVGVLVASTGGWAVALGRDALRDRTWTYKPLVMTYATLVPVAIAWLISFLGNGNSIVYGAIHLPIWLFGLYLSISTEVREHLHGDTVAEMAKPIASFSTAGTIAGLLFAFTGPKIITTLVGSVLSIVIAGALFVGINKLFELARVDFQLFSTVAMGLLGALVGGLIALNAPPLGGWPMGVVTILVVGAAFAALGRVRGGRADKSSGEITKLIESARVWIFVGPALIFIAVSLVIPTIRTMFLSFFGGDSSEFVGFRNFGWVFTSDSFFSVSGWRDIFGSNLTLWGVILLGLALGLATVYGQRRGGGMDFQGGPTVLMFLGGIFVLFAVFTSLRGAIWNNLWWVAAVTGFSTALGLLTAVIAERIKYEKAAKALIFLPMAISMVGAGVIWKFIYDFSTRGDQVGLLNAVWQWMGNDAVFWLGERPWNNFLLIIVMIWIQTGFAMVVLSAALKGVPEDQIEAAKVDGATEVDIFWKITIPTIRSTIAVVMTTLIILVMKVYDIVKVMTNGEFGTEVLANAMFNQAFTFRSFGRGSALATLLFLAVLPMMYLNIRRTRQEALLR
jgi:alpha-glucoside transport system permease protein